MPSTALTNFVTTDYAVQGLLTIEARYKDPPTVPNRPKVEGLRGGAAVLMVAAFENYLREAVSEFLDQINSSTPSCDFSKLPSTLQKASIVSGLEIAMRGRPGAKKRTDSQRIADIRTIATRIVNDQINSSEVANTRSNPNSELVQNMFRSVGVRNVFSKAKASFDTLWGVPTAATFIRDNLDAIVQRRHIVAHTASALSISRVDLAEGRRFVSILTPVLDDLLEKTIARVIANAQ